MSAYSMPGATARLVCDPGPDHDHIQVTVYDGRLDPLPLAYNLGRIEVDVTPGAYKVEFGTEAETRSQLVVVSGHDVERQVTLPASVLDRSELDTATDQLKVASAAPVQGASTSHEYQRYPAETLSTTPPVPAPRRHAGDGHLFLFVREADEAAAKRANPARGLSLHTLDGTRLFDFGRAKRVEDVALHDLPSFGRHGLFDAVNHWTAIHVGLAPGAYLLRLTPGAGPVLQQVLHLRSGWQTQTFLLTRTYGRGQRRRRQADLPRISVFMARPTEGFRPHERGFYLTEVALRALADGRSVPGEERTEMLHGKFENPMLGLYGAFLHLRRHRVVLELLSEVFDNLYGLLGPHPDVLALGWAALTRGRAEGADGWILTRVRKRVEVAGPIDVPPMLRASWDHLIEASYDRPGIIPPGSLAERVAGRGALAGAWLIWPTDPMEMKKEPAPEAPVPSPPHLLELLPPVLWNANDPGGLFESVRFERKTVQGTSGREEPDESEAESPSAERTPEREDILAALQRTLDLIAARLEADPSEANRFDEKKLSALEWRVARAAFPETDPLFSALAKRERTRLVVCQSSNDGYSLLSLTRASWVVNCQSAPTWSWLR